MEKVVLTFLGSGSAFTVGYRNFHSNMLLTKNNSTLLIDCGSDVRFSLNEQGLSYNDIDDIYISHLHADHVGGLEWLGFNRKFNSTKPKPILHISDLLAKKLWDNVLSGGMTSLGDHEATIEDFFDIKLITQKHQNFIWQDIEFKLIRTVHYYCNQQLVPTFGLFFCCNQQKIFITADTQFVPNELGEYFSAATIIFHDCNLKNNPVHANYNDLKNLEPNIKSKMWLYHFDDHTLPDAKQDGFLGFVTKGQRFYF